MGRQTPRYCKSMDSAGSRRVILRPTEATEKGKHDVGVLWNTMAYSLLTGIQNSLPSCSTGWMTCLCFISFKSRRRVSSLTIMASSTLSAKIRSFMSELNLSLGCIDEHLITRMCGGKKSYPLSYPCCSSLVLQQVWVQVSAQAHGAALQVTQQCGVLGPPERNLDS